jgi:hypothetical protein
MVYGARMAPPLVTQTNELTFFQVEGDLGSLLEQRCPFVKDFSGATLFGDLAHGSACANDMLR